MKMLTRKLTGLACAGLMGVLPAFSQSVRMENRGSLKVAIIQFDPISGDFEYNLKKISEGYARAVAEGADLAITPETADVGYSYGDYLERPEVWDIAEAYFEKYKALTKGKKTALLMGHIAKNRQDEWGKPLQNMASGIVDGEVVYQHAKMLLPDYDIFNDARWFHPGDKVGVWKFKGYNIAVAICEDWWFNDKFIGPQGQRRYYKNDPVAMYLALPPEDKPDLAISLSASPAGRDKAAYREEVHSDVAIRLGTPFLWVGMTGATDSIQYDGRSFFLNGAGQTVDRLALYKNDFATVNFPDGLLGLSTNFQVVKDSAGENTNPDEREVVYQALLNGIREYARRNGIKGFVLGVSGGLDSAVAAALIVDALGPDALKAYGLPSKYSPDHSISDALALVKNLGIKPENFDLVPIGSNLLIEFDNPATGKRETIGGPYDAVRRALEKFWTDEGLIDENTQARLRMLYLNGIANATPGYMVAATSNKTEIAMGYFTFGGDDKGGLAILGGLWKSEVYEMADYINQRSGRERIPNNTIKKPASADLKTNQQSYGSQDGMPPYYILDPLLADFFERKIPVAELDKYYRSFIPTWGKYGKRWVIDILKHAENQEFKRKQLPPTLRVGRGKDFDWIGRRNPISRHSLAKFAYQVDLSCEIALAKESFPRREWYKSTLRDTVGNSK